MTRAQSGDKVPDLLIACLDLGGDMNSDRATFLTRIALSAATAILILAGATLNANGRVGEPALLAAIAGLLALLAGALNRTWKVAVPLGIAALVVSVITPGFSVSD